MFPNSCVEKTSQINVVLKENQRTFIAVNNNSLLLRKIRFDGCVIKITDRQKVCDYGLWVDHTKTAYLIELKGKQIAHACKQILETLSFIKRNHSDEFEGVAMMAVIVSSANNVPRLQQQPAYVLLIKQCKAVIIKTVKYEAII